MAQELEMKILTSYEEFDRCRAFLQQHTGHRGDRYVQVNYYFDTPDLRLASARTMLRVRRKKNALLLQYKNKRERKGDLLLCDEWEAPLPCFPSSVDPSEYFPEAPHENCVLLGNLVTDRTDFVFDGAVVSLDESIYFGKSDYEIEIEGDRSAIERLSRLFSPKGESGKGLGKFSRFLKEYQQYTTPHSSEGEIL